MVASTMRISLLCYGNPDRGDDAAGSIIYQWATQLMMQQASLPDALELHLVEDFQLAPEHIYDLQGSAVVIFVDCMMLEEDEEKEKGNEADNSKGEPIWKPLQAGHGLMFTSHSLPPESLLFLYQTSFHQPAPPCFLLGIPGRNFTLGSPISAATQTAITAAQQLLLAKLHEFCAQSEPPCPDITCLR